MIAPQPVDRLLAGIMFEERLIMEQDVKVNSHGINAKIQGHILPDEQMRAIGFTDYDPTHWYFCRIVNFPKIIKTRNLIISFNVTIPKDGSDIRIDILDDDWCQPYDYQYLLYKNPTFRIALIVKEQVEEWMEYLQANGVLSGHVKGEYI